MFDKFFRLKFSNCSILIRLNWYLFSLLLKNYWLQQCLQNKHPLLAMYKAHIKTDDMSFSESRGFLSLEDKTKIIDFLANLVFFFARGYQCEFCGFQMWKVKQEISGIGYEHGERKK